MSTLSEIGDYLVAQGIGLLQKPSTGANLFLGSRPDSPDEVVALYEYPGGPPEYVQDQDGPNAEKVQLQVVTRANDYETAWNRANRCWRALASVKNTTLGTTKYRSVRPNASPSNMGRDSNDRNLIFFNCTVDKEVSIVA